MVGHVPLEDGILVRIQVPEPHLAWLKCAKTGTLCISRDSSSLTRS